MSEANPHAGGEPFGPEDDLAFTSFLQHVEDELAKYTDDDHRRAMAQILRDADRIELAEKLEKEITDGG